MPGLSFRHLHLNWPRDTQCGFLPINMAWILKRAIQRTFLQNYLKICQSVWEKNNFEVFFCFVAMETRILHGSQYFEGILVRSLRGCFLWSFILIDPLVTEEKILTDDRQKAITITHLEQSSGELKIHWKTTTILVIRI